MIRAGRVVVDGELAHLGQKVDPTASRVEVDGMPLPIRPDLVYLLLYKPKGIVSTAHDPHGRPTVVDHVDAATRVYPVGRLDADTEGLLILTNDGELTELLTHPRHRVTKTYVAVVSGHLGPAALQALTAGVELEDGPAAAVSTRLLDRSGSTCLVELVMTEGRRREVRRMLEAVGHPVIELVRTGIGPLRDRELKPGEWRELTVSEVRELYAAAGVG